MSGRKVYLIVMDRRKFTLLVALGLVVTPLFTLPVQASDDDAHEDDKNDPSDDKDKDDDKEEDSDKDEDDHSDTDDTESESDSEEEDHPSGEDDEDDHDEERARNAVEQEGVKPLREMLTVFSDEVGGQVIDVDLVRNWFHLQYKFTYLDNVGRIRKVYFDATSGELLD